MAKHVAVLMGGLSKEREVSLSSGKGVSKALKKVGYRVTDIDVGHDIGKRLEQVNPDVAFIALHGTYGEDGCIQGLLELMKIPYTHSGVLASAVAMDKPTAKKVFAAAGIRCPEGKTMKIKEIAELARKKKHPMGKPYVIKPTNNGSSVGVIIVEGKDTLDFNEKKWDFGGEALVEEFIPGREISAAILNGKALGAIEIRAKKGFYDYKAKYTVGKAEHIMPAEIHKAAYKKILEISEMAYRALGCRGVARTDIRYDDTKGEPGKAVLLEINTHPGMTPLSLTPEIARHCGIEYHDLVDDLVKNAACDNM